MLRIETMSLDFNDNDPFPLFPIGTYTYEEEKHHAIMADEWLGFRCEEVEKKISANPVYKIPEKEFWIGLPVQALQTPYVEIRSILALLSPRAGQTIIDLGCGFGRMAFVVGRYYPGVNFIGYESVKERVVEAQRVMSLHKISSAEIFEQDLADEAFELPDANFYFIFDFGSGPDIEKILGDLRVRARTEPVVVIARGRRIRQLIHANHPWLAAVQKPQHYPHFSIYRS